MPIANRLLIATALVALRWPPAVAGQRQVGLLYGNWKAGRTVTYEARLDRPWGSMLRHGIALQAASERGGAARAFYGVGYELQVLRGRTVLGPYAVLSAALGGATDTAGQALAALWSAGAGLEWRPFRYFAIDVEARYRVRDRGPRGFWRPGASHQWWSTTLGVAIALGGSSRRASAASRSAEWSPAADPPRPPLMLVGRSGDVVQTALDVIGSPYQWGGTAQNGFDCSGLIQYAYGRHGIRLPRMSRDQAQAGSAVPLQLDSLRPGDILAFSAQPGGAVTHVGLYAGAGRFIHSSSTGVRVSRLERDDPDGRYWIPRWAGARRVLP